MSDESFLERVEEDLHLRKPDAEPEAEPVDEASEPVAEMPEGEPAEAEEPAADPSVSVRQREVTASQVGLDNDDHATRIADAHAEQARLRSEALGPFEQTLADEEKARLDGVDVRPGGGSSVNGPTESVGLATAAQFPDGVTADPLAPAPEPEPEPSV